jgi:hypothetical protein
MAALEINGVNFDHFPQSPDFLIVAAFGFLFSKDAG